MCQSSEIFLEVGVAGGVGGGSLAPLGRGGGILPAFMVWQEGFRSIIPRYEELL